MVDPQNDHRGMIVVDLMDNTVGTPTCRPQTLELPLQRVADAARRIYQGPDMNSTIAAATLSGMAGVLARKVPSAQPWRFTTTDYLQAVRHGLGTVPLSGAPHVSPWDPGLAPILKTAGTAIYEEQVIEDLLGDLDNSRREPDQPKRSPGRGHSA